MTGTATGSGAQDGASGALRATLIKAAREILDEPDTALDLRKVAERAGKSRTAPYLVFGKTEHGGGLEALRLAVAAEGTSELSSSIASAVAAAADPEASVQRLAEAYVEFARRHPRLFRLMFGPEVARAMRVSATGEPPAEAAGLIHARAHLEEQFRAAIEQGREVGAIEPDDTWTLVLGAWMMLHGAALLMLDGQLPAAGTGDDAAGAAALATRFLLDEAALPVARAAASLAKSEAEKHLSSVAFDRASPARFVLREQAVELFTPRSLEEPSLDSARAVLARSPALRRARRMRRVIEGCRILWIDDQPDISRFEQEMLEDLGAEVVRALDTGEALELLEETGFDVIISDIARPAAPRAGVEDLPKIRELAPELPVIFYVGHLKSGAGIPAGASGITAEPGELLHLILDQLERRRM